MNCIIVHGCPGRPETDPKTRTYDKHWMPWLKAELEKHGVKTYAPLMPEPWKPEYERFKQAFPEERVTEDTVLIGHSCGTTFLLRWLGETKRRAKKLILVAPWKIPDRDAERELCLFDIDPGINDRVGSIVAFTSDNEREHGKRSLDIIKGDLDMKVVSLPKHGHYTERDMGTTEFPELLDEALR